MENTLAALAAEELGVARATIARVLASFGARPSDNPGRLKQYRIDGAHVHVDDAHNPAGPTALLGVARRIPPRRLLLLLGQAGNRDDDAIADLVRAAWSARSDRIIIKELDSYRRGREVGEVTTLLAAELSVLGAQSAQLEVVADELAAVEAALRWARPGGVLVLPMHAAPRAPLLLLGGEPGYCARFALGAVAALPSICDIILHCLCFSRKRQFPDAHSGA